MVYAKRQRKRGVIRPIDHLASDTSVYIFVEESSMTFRPCLYRSLELKCIQLASRRQHLLLVSNTVCVLRRIIYLSKAKRNLLYTG